MSFILTELIDKITTIIKQGVVIEDGKAQIFTESKEMMTRLNLLVDLCVSMKELDRNVNLQKKILTALFTISKRK